MNNNYKMQQRTEQNDFAGVVYGLLGSCIWGIYMAVSSQGIADAFSAEDLAFLRISMLDFDQVLFQDILFGVLALFAFSKAVQYLSVEKAVLFPAFSPSVTMLSGIFFIPSNSVF